MQVATYRWSLTQIDIDVQSNTSLDANSFTIQSSRILHGYTPQANTRHSTGLDIHVYDSCLGFNVKVDNE